MPIEWIESEEEMVDYIECIKREWGNKVYVK